MKNMNFNLVRFGEQKINFTGLIFEIYGIYVKNKKNSPTI